MIDGSLLRDDIYETLLSMRRRLVSNTVESLWEEHEGWREIVSKERLAREPSGNAHSTTFDLSMHPAFVGCPESCNRYMAIDSHERLDGRRRLRRCVCCGRFRHDGIQFPGGEWSCLLAQQRNRKSRKKKVGGGKQKQLEQLCKSEEISTDQARPVNHLFFFFSRVSQSQINFITVDCSLNRRLGPW